MKKSNKHFKDEDDFEDYDSYAAYTFSMFIVGANPSIEDRHAFESVLKALGDDLDLTPELAYDAGLTASIRSLGRNKEGKSIH